MHTRTRAAAIRPPTAGRQRSTGSYPGLRPDEQVWRRLYHATLIEAYRRKLPQEDAEDAAMQAVARCLFTVRPAGADCSPPDDCRCSHHFALSDAEIQKRAHTEARNHCRARLRDRARLVSLSYLEAGGPYAFCRLHNRLTVQQTALQRQYFRTSVAVALRALPPETAALVYEHHIEGHTLVSLSTLYGCSPEAIRKRLTRALQQARKALCGREWDEKGVF